MAKASPGLSSNYVTFVCLYIILSTIFLEIIGLCYVLYETMKILLCNICNLTSICTAKQKRSKYS